MSSNKKMPELFQVKTTLANFRGYKNVMFWWFVETRKRSYSERTDRSGSNTET